MQVLYWILYFTVGSYIALELIFMLLGGIFFPITRSLIEDYIIPRFNPKTQCRLGYHHFKYKTVQVPVQHARHSHIFHDRAEFIQAECKHCHKKMYKAQGPMYDWTMGEITENSRLVSRNI